MQYRLSKPNPEVAQLAALLERVRMPEYERLRARAHLDRAEAVADLLARAWTAVRSMSSAFVVRPIHRLLAWMA